jgi:hypothetical protein
MSWEKLTDSSFVALPRGYLLKFPASAPFESEVVMMICGHPEGGRRLASVALISITGYCAGINPYVEFPSTAIEEEAGISRKWLIENWTKWVWPKGNVSDVLVRKELDAADL